MATILRFILDVEQKFQGTDTLDIYNTDVAIRPSELEYGTQSIAPLLRFILKFERKFKGTATVDIDNVAVQ
jgi:hypothetical protein